MPCLPTLKSFQVLCDTPPALGVVMVTTGTEVLFLPVPLPMPGWFALGALGSVLRFWASAPSVSTHAAEAAVSAAASVKANAFEMPRVLAIVLTNSLIRIFRALPTGALMQCLGAAPMPRAKAGKADQHAHGHLFCLSKLERQKRPPAACFAEGQPRAQPCTGRGPLASTKSSHGIAYPQLYRPPG